MSANGRLITHSGSFHADDVFSFVILKTLFPNHVLLRTRDEAVFQNAKPEDIVFDVGMRYSPTERRYDHHMRSSPLRENGFPYSSVGLVWKFHGRDYLRSLMGAEASDEIIDRIWKKMDDEIIFNLDCGDTGFDPSPTMSSRLSISISVLLEVFNPVSDEPSPDYDAAFMKAAQYWEEVLVRKVEHLHAYERARGVVLSALAQSSDPRILELPTSVEWMGHLFEMGNDTVLYAVYPAHGSWYCSAAKVGPGSWDNRQDLPSTWGGLRYEALAHICGTPDAVFCHDKLFVCVAESREGIMDMVAKALQNVPQPKL